jgi:DNA-directed RNA polymerase subunit RPC12/RpoP
MDEYICLRCGHTWASVVISYRDWKRRKCPSCGKRRTVKREIFDRAVDEFARSLQFSTPPHPPTPSAVSATFVLLKEMFPDSSVVTVLLDVYKAACQKIGREANVPDQV